MVRCFLLAYLYIGYWYRYCGNLSSNCISDTFLTAVKPVNTSGVPFFFSLLTWKSVRRTFFLVWFKKNQQHFSPCFEVFKLHLPVSLFSLNKPGVTSLYALQPLTIIALLWHLTACLWKGFFTVSVELQVQNTLVKVIFLQFHL